MSMTQSLTHRIPPLNKFHIPRILTHSRRTPHRPISTEPSLPPPHNDIQPNRSDIAHGAEHGERKERLVAAADGDACRRGPVLGCALGQDGAGHAVREEGEGEEPEEEVGGVEEEGEFCGEGAGAVAEAGEGDC